MRQPDRHAYKLGLRAALLVGGSAVDRIEIKDIVKNFYDARSKVVHGSAAGKNLAVIDQGLDICARVLRRMVEIGREPDWSKLELSGGSEF